MLPEALYTYLTHITEKYGCYIANIGHIAIKLNVHIGIQTKNICIYMQCQLHMLLTNMCQKQIYLPSWTYIPYTGCAYMKDVKTHICHV